MTSIILWEEANDETLEEEIYGLEEMPTCSYSIQ